MIISKVNDWNSLLSDALLMPENRTGRFFLEIKEYSHINQVILGFKEGDKSLCIFKRTTDIENLVPLEVDRFHKKCLAEIFIWSVLGMDLVDSEWPTLSLQTLCISGLDKLKDE